MNLRLLILSLFLLFSSSAIAFIFWHQEIRYSLPAPVPAGYQQILPMEEVNVSGLLPSLSNSKPTLIHFFNPLCPCSRFNTQHFKSLVAAYGQQVNFIAVVPADDLVEEARTYFPDKLTVVADSNEAIAQACGVYATPQAALLTPDSKLYYRGNYNKARYCTQAQSNYAQLAIEDLLAGLPAKAYGVLATQSYGCSLDERGLGFNPFQ
jgi:hypothetical protein